MKKIVLLLILCIMLPVLSISTASAEDYSFSDFYGRLTLPKGAYSPVVTADNFTAYADFLVSQGYDMDELNFEFLQNGLRIIAFDQSNSRRFVLTAVQDVNAKTYFDLNEQDEDMRKTFRLSHNNGTAYGLLGYTYSSAQWKNYGTNVDRFLQTLYTLRQDGTQVCSGAQRRTIRNGYTITLDLQVYGRGRADSDVKALETIMKTFSFTRILPMPALPIKLALSSEPPQETHDETCTVAGTTLAKASVTVNVLSVSGTYSQSYTANVNNSGKFSTKIKFPSRGVYAVSITAKKEGSVDAVQTYSVTYDPNRLIARVTQPAPDELTSETVIKGTCESGVTTQLIVTGPIQYTKSVTGKSFSFTVDTSAEGSYHFRLVMTRKGYNERSFEYDGTRSLTAAERRDQIRKQAIKPDYARLVQNSASYNGQIFGYTGYLTDCREGSGDYLYTVALTKSQNTYKQLLYIASENPVSFSIGDKVKVYATKTGDIITINDSGNTEYTPLFDILFMENAN